MFVICIYFTTWVLYIIFDIIKSVKISVIQELVSFNIYVD